MHRKLAILVFIFCLLFFTVIGCSQDKSRTSDEPTEQIETPSTEIPNDPENNFMPNTPSNNQDQEIQAIIDSMNLEEKLGQLLYVGVSGTALNDNTKELIHKYKVGGIIFFRANFETSTQALELINSIKTENAANPLPLFLGVDQEGGPVARLPEVTVTPSAGKIGKQRDAQLAYEIGKLLGGQLSAFGLNMNFAPVLDVNSNPNNPVIGIRAFSNEASTVSKLGTNMMKGIQANNVIPVVKHFPGHGDTTVDSHLDLPSVNKNIDELEKLELIPFREAIQNKADVVMIAHILLHQIDDQFPASLSSKVIADILRKELDFEGLVITDDLTMNAIVNHYDLGAAAVASIIAGGDMIMVAHEYVNVLTAYNALKDAVQNGIINEDRINESLYRIITVKKKYKLTNDIIDRIDVNVLNQSAENVLSKMK